jgi:hypothetical protein
MPRYRSGMFTFRSAHSGDLFPQPAAPRRDSEPSADVHELRGEIERLYFITEALWRILKEKHALDDNEIVRQITMIDMEDGALDGRKAKVPPKPCPRCSRPLGKQRLKCMYCGELIVNDPFAR